MKVSCSACGKQFEASRRSAMFCGVTCRQRAARASKAAPPDADPTPIDRGKREETAEHPLIATTRRDLEAAGQLDTVVGQQALRLAEKLTSPFDTGSATAAVSKEFRAVMAEALKDQGKQVDSLDELASRRLKRASGA